MNNLIQKEKSPALKESDIFKDIAISLNSNDYVEDANSVNFDKREFWQEDIEPIENNQYSKPN